LAQKGHKKLQKI